MKQIEIGVLKMLENQFTFLDESINKALEKNLNQISIEESGTIITIDSGIAIVKGITKIKNEELIF